jgi:glutamate racemase
MPLVSEPLARIGVLDSGVGGLSVLREIHRLLPDHPTLYFADQFHLPYGPRDPQQISTFVEAIARFLIERGAAIIVIACNSASAASLYNVRAQYPHVPFVGMEPAVKPAVEATRTGVIGVLTTRATAEGVLYRQVLERYAANTRVITQVAPELVRVAEENSQHTPDSHEIIRRHIQPIRDAGADQIALACTHFPFLAKAIQEIAGGGVHLIDPGPAIARQAARVWPTGVATLQAENVYYTSGSPKQFRQMLHTFIGINAPVQGVCWPSDYEVRDCSGVGSPGITVAD